MVVSRSWPKGAKFAPFGLALLAGVLMPNSIGYQDLASLIAQQPEVSARWRAHMIASPFGTIHAATFSFPRPIGTAIPEPENIRLASFDPDEVGLTGDRDDSSGPLVFPTVDRTKKGDFLGYRTPPASAPEPAPESAPAAVIGPAVTPALNDFVSPLDSAADAELPVFDIAKEAALPLPAAQSVDEIEAAVRFEPFPQYDISMSLEFHPQIPVEPVDPVNPEGGQPDISLISMANDPDPTERMARLFFGGSPMNTFSAAIQPWAAGEEPVFMMPRAPGSGVTTANKGEVTGEGQVPKSPADRLKLAGKTRDKAERCLANAVYFEAGREPVRGQIGVAQVVLNRVFSGFYPHDVCGVIYQNANRHLACQFTFACDGIPDVVTDQESWARAKRIAKATLDGKVWLPEIGKATHYHASYVHPYWVRSMRKLHRIGAHIFYRPRVWGDGADAPSWGSTTAATATASQL